MHTVRVVEVRTSTQHENKLNLEGEEKRERLERREGKRRGG